MSIHPLLKYSLVVLMIGSACDNASTEQKKAVNAQAEANDKIVTAAKEADQKSNSAQIEANKKIADAQANFMKLREDYRHKVANDLVELDHKVAELEGKEKDMHGKAKADLEAKLDRIRNSRASFAAAYKSLEVESAATWDATKARLDKQWDDLRALAD